MDRQEQLEELKANPRKVRFTRLCQIAEAFDFKTRKGTGSHLVYFREGIRQFIKVIEKYNLQED